MISSTIVSGASASRSCVSFTGPASELSIGRTPYAASPAVTASATARKLARGSADGKSAAESILVGAPLNAERTHAAMVTLRAAIDPDADVHATAAYRRHLVGVLLERAVSLAYSRAAGVA